MALILHFPGGLLLGLLAATGPSEPGGSCQVCHRKLVHSYSYTAHARTSRLASARSIKGSFAPGHNILHTRSPDVYFLMEQRPDGFYQTGIHRGSGRNEVESERFDLVVGSGRKGQSYLFWRQGLLFQLPVSYLVGTQSWINSPGYPDGQVNFGRLIQPRCLECHATAFPLEVDRGVARYSSQYTLGISCEKCHGDGTGHVRYYAAHPGAPRGHEILAPATFSRERRLDNCGLCHSGGREPRQPAFSYKPGEPLDDYFVALSDKDPVVPDVHGNQLGLLRRSKCFRSSPTLTCSTCHDVHRTQRDLLQFAHTCMGCHDTTQHPQAAEMGTRLQSLCIDCHMPNQLSKVIHINTPLGEFAPTYRSHAIGIYRERAAELLERPKQP